MNHALTIFPTKLALAPFVREPQGTQAALRIDLGARSYPILIGTDILDQASSWDNLPEAAQALIVSNTTVAPLYAARLQQVLAGRFRQVLCVELPDGEQHKTWQSLNRIFDALLEHQCDRKTVLFALGGGVVGDITGFAAACYMRGVPFVQVPTTLLAQVDSSVGGKTAINHPLGKNMIGAFYQPRRVVCDMATLATLPEREFSAGLAEIIKYGPIADMEFFDWLEQNMQALRARQHDVMRVAVQRSCEIKAWVVAQDEQEGGMRAILNFGHTFAHAIEAGLGFGTWLHGEAVGCGLVMAVHLSQQLDWWMRPSSIGRAGWFRRPGCRCRRPCCLQTNQPIRRPGCSICGWTRRPRRARFVLWCWRTLDRLPWFRCRMRWWQASSRHAASPVEGTVNGGLYPRCWRRS